MAFLLAPETPPFTHQFTSLRVNLHLSICACWHRPPSSHVATPVDVVRFACHQTCRTTCGWFAAGGGISLLGCRGFSIVVAGFEVGLGIDAVLGSFLIHREDARLPLGVVMGNTESDIRNGSGVVPWDSLSYGFY